MTHLRIEQNTTGIEEVSASIISKLYELAYAGLDASSNLLGRLHVTKAYGDEIDWLTLTYTNLYITADARYIKFADPNMQALMALYYGDGTGTTLLDMQSVTRITGTKFEGESITSFDELGLFTSVVSIGYRAFKDCTSLTSIDLSNITNLDTAALRNCTSLTGTIYLPSLTTFAAGDNGAFQDCTGITSVVIGGNTPTLTNTTLKKIFYGCTALTSVTGLSDLTSIPVGCFYNCTSLTTVDIDWTKVTTLYDECFSGCPLTGSISLTSLITLGNTVFRGSKFTSIVLPSNITKTGARFCLENDTLTSINTENITDFDPRCFSNCTSLSSLDFSSATILGEYAITHTALSGSIVFPSTLILFGNESFSYNSNVTSIEITAPSVSFGSSCFCGNTGLTKFVLRCTTVPTLNNTKTFEGSYPIYVVDNLLSSYLAASIWSNISSRLHGISEIPTS